METLIIKQMNKTKQFLQKLNNKKIRRVLYVVCLVLFVVLFVRYKIYKQAKIYYNKGVNFYQDEDYYFAEKYFSYSLLYKIPKRLECKSRINYALSITTPITKESVTPKNIDESIERLEEARSILVQHDCAHMYDSDGHNKKAQTLKQEIDEYIEYLKSEKEKFEEEKKADNLDKSSDEDKKNEEEKKKEEAKKLREEEAKLEEVFGQIEQEGLNERTNNLNTYEQWSTESTYYSGKSW